MYQVDAFASKPFTGNPAAVCVLESWPEDALLQAIAAENNLAETAFFTSKADGSYDLRWFTPTFEIPLCGHATLASAYVLFRCLGYHERVIRFHSLSGELFVSQEGELLMMDFPAYDPEPAQLTEEIAEAVGGRPAVFLRADINYYAVFESEEKVRALIPDYGLVLNILSGTPMIGFVATAKGRDYDFVSRYFAPEEGTGITEDPVTGSIHAALVPFWAEKLGKRELRAYQASERGGELFCTLKEAGQNRRTLIGGYVQPYLQGTIEV